ncbi:MAG: tRNA lysidine(34) synthetase TilS, partial [Pseudomonadota bacterium]
MDSGRSAAIDTFQACWAGAGKPTHVLLAVSGGGDSMGLLAVAAALRNEPDLLKISVATVDHGLRPQSTAEAVAVSDATNALGFDHHLLTWRDTKPDTGLQAAARAARYRLLALCAEEYGADAIVTAHTLEDVAETFLMRLSRGSGARALSSMHNQISIANGAGKVFPLMRPFLSIKRADLRGIAIAADLPVVDDPSNSDQDFERVRVRQALVDGGNPFGLSVDAIGSAAMKLANAAHTEQKNVERIASGSNLSFHDAGYATFDWAEFRRSEHLDSRAASFLADVLFAVSGRDHAPNDDAVRSALAALCDGKKQVSLGGCLIKRAADGLCMVLREPAAVLGRHGVEPYARRDVRPGEKILWDGRFIIANNASGSACIDVWGR